MRLLKNTTLRRSYTDSSVNSFTFVIALCSFILSGLKQFFIFSSLHHCFTAKFWNLHIHHHSSVPDKSQDDDRPASRYFWFFCVSPLDNIWAQTLSWPERTIPSTWMDSWDHIVLTQWHRSSIEHVHYFHYIWRELRLSQPDFILGCLSRNTLHSWPLFSCIYYLSAHSDIYVF